MRYELVVKDQAQDSSFKPLVLARVFPGGAQGQATAERYLQEKVLPLVATMRNRPELEPFATPAAILNELPMVFHVFPLDGELPTLVQATEPAYMLDLLRSALPAARDRHLILDSCQVDLGHYGRQHRCVLRYTIDGHSATTHEQRRQQIYGKVAADGRGELVDQALTLLRQRLRPFNHGASFRIPNTLGYYPDLNLILLDAVPGQPQLSTLLKGQAVAGALTLNQALATAAQMAARLHLSEIQLGRLRTLKSEVDELQAACQIARELTPALALHLQELVNRLKPYLAQPTLPYCFSHGDFTHTQIIFEGTVGGLVDFDTICQAEPALDLGQFTAYVRLAVAKATAAGTATEEDAEQLCLYFLQAYGQAIDYTQNTITYLHERTQIYEVVSLLRIALHSWQKLKAVRLEQVMTILEERIACLPPLRQLQPTSTRKPLPWLTGATMRQGNGST